MPKAMTFLDKFKKQVNEVEGVSLSAGPPKFWIGMGNYVLNLIMSGDPYKGIPQGRITLLTGPSSSGKSFLAANIAAAAQKEGCFVLVLDSEHALDNDFVAKIGVDPTDTSTYLGVEIDTFPQATEMLAEFLKGYSADQDSAKPTMPEKLLIILDSLDMLQTDTEFENFQKGIMKGDQGQRAKQGKGLLRCIVHPIKRLNIAVLITGQPYRAKQEQILEGEGKWVINDAIRFAFSQIVLITKTKLKDAKIKTMVKGIKMKCEGFKTRFTQPYQTVSIEVPYDTGMDKYSGLANTAVELGIVQKKGGWHTIKGETDNWYEKDIAKHADKILAMISEQRSYLHSSVEEADYDEDGKEVPSE